MKIIYITGGLTPYRIAFCDKLNDYLMKEKKGELKLFLLSEESFNSNYNNKELMRAYAKFIPGRTITLKDQTTRFMINPSIIRHIKQEKPDFIILGGSWTHPSTWILLANKKQIKAPIYFWAESHLHNGLKRKQKKWWKEILKRRVYNYFDGFFVPGLYAREAISETKCKNQSNYYILPNLIEEEKYMQANARRKKRDELRKKYNVTDSQCVLFTPSRLVDLKGIIEFLDNGESILQNENIVWIIAGIGPLEEEIRKKAENKGIKVQLVGFIEQDKIIDYLAMVDFFVLPSLSDPNPLSVIEALWAGLPIVLSKYVGNVPETLVERSNGFVFDTLSKEEVERVLLLCLLSDSEWKQKAGQISREKAEVGFNMNREIKKMVNKIEEIIYDNSKK